MSELDDQFPHPLNREILSSYLGGHPDYGQRMDGLADSLPTECRFLRFPYAESFTCALLAHEGIVFGAHISMRIWLRLPEHAGVPASTSNRSLLSQAWVDITWMERSEQQRLVHLAYEYAAELAKTPLVETVIVVCPNCSQKLRAPSHLGTLNLTCPKCKQSWLWSPE